MRNKYDFSKAIKNPYAKKLKKPISIRIDEDVIDYFKKIADDVGVSYQVLMNLNESLSKASEERRTNAAFCSGSKAYPSKKKGGVNK